MRSIVFLLVTFITAPLFSVSARAGDDPCLGATFFGSCDGTRLEHCADEGTEDARFLAIDCATSVFPDDVAGTCALIDDDYGFDCAVLPGEECSFLDPLTNARVYGMCNIPDEGACVLTETSVCAAVPGGPGCDPADVGECVGELLQIDCSAAQRVFIDCAIFGGTCGDGACQDLPLDAECDAGVGVRRCGDGLSCFNERCVETARLCQAENFVAACVNDDIELCLGGLRTTITCEDAIGVPGTCDSVLSCNADDTTCAPPQGCIADEDDDGIQVCDVVGGVFCGEDKSCVLGLYSDLFEGHCEAAVGACAAGVGNLGCIGDVATGCLSDGTHTFVEPFAIDCATLGSACSVIDDEAVCVGQEGATCDPSGGALLCSSPFVCRNINGRGRCAANTAPPAPDALSPANNAVFLEGAAIALEARAVVDADGDAVTYTFQVASDADFSTITATSGSLASPLFTIPGPVAVGSYHWRVRASDGLEDGTSAFGSVGTFSVEVNVVNTAPTAPGIVRPTNTTIIVNNATLTITASTDADGDDLQYEFEIATNNAFANATVSGLQAGLTFAVTNLEDAQHFWRARAFDGELYSEWSNATFLVVAEDAPPIPQPDPDPEEPFTLVGGGCRCSSSDDGVGMVAVLLALRAMGRRRRG